ncbi:MAG: cation:proton antiporter, partial [Oscillospiraceae bacterium]
MKLSILTQSTESAVLLSLAVILFSGFLVTRLTKLCHLPNVSGFILAGVLIGPGVLNIVPQYIIENMGFMSDIALSFIAFGVGKFFKREIIKSTGKKIVIITLFESIAAGVVVTLAMRFIFSLDRNFALLLGAIATATAPASTMMTINQYHARGEFVNTLLQVVALDDVVCLFVYSVVAAFINSDSGEKLLPSLILLPIIFNIAALLLGFLMGLALKSLLSSPTRSDDNRLILTISMLLTISGLCSLVEISPLLS